MVPDPQTGHAQRDVASLDLILTPHGHIILSETEDATALDREAARRLRHAFESGTGGGLLRLGAGEVETALPPTFGYWRDFAARYVTALCAQPDAAIPPGGAARLDHRPELLFRLRKVDEQDLVARAAADVPLTRKGPAAGKVLEAAEVAGVFGVEFAPQAPAPAAKRRPAAPPLQTTRPAGSKKAKRPVAGAAKATKGRKRPKPTADRVVR